MIAAVRQLHKPADQLRRPRPATKSLVATATSATDFQQIAAQSVAVIRPNLPACSIEPAKRVQRTSHAHRQRRNPHST
jgi:hypothetical protein